MKKRTRESANPDITPLIDVVFLLLIFFMVSTVFKKEEFALLLNLPTVEEGESENQKKDIKNILIELSKDQIAYNKTKLTFETLPQQLSTLKDKTTAIELRIDKKVEYDRVVKLLNMLKSYKLNNLNLITDK